MFIKDLLNQGTPSFSFEFFPPKTDEAFDALMETIRELQKLHPTFVSVTYGAGGSTRRRTIDIVAKAKGELGQESMAHLTCVGSTEQELRDVLDELRRQGIENVLPLRGDPPAGTDVFEKTPGGFGYANELVSFIKEDYDFCLGVAGYPEGHQEADDFDTDLANLKLKVDAGADFVITQMFFDNRFYFEFVAQARAIGIDVPLIPGIMPIGNFEQIQRFTKMCGASIPARLMEELEQRKDEPESIHHLGVAYATIQCLGLLQGGAFACVVPIIQSQTVAGETVGNNGPSGYSTTRIERRFVPWSAALQVAVPKAILEPSPWLRSLLDCLAPGWNKPHFVAAAPSKPEKMKPVAQPRSVKPGISIIPSFQKRKK